MSLTIDSLGALLVVLLVSWLWLNTLRARELALAQARRACQRADVQLLDQAVALRGMALVWTPRGVRLRRRYRFEFSSDGVERRTGQLALLGLRLESLWLEPDDTNPDGGPDDGAARGRFEP
ncbi:DUF3301 domain-containing protein [Thiohalocapsa halophila]|uniref:DUF3301 domain-containing protein n=1 Tax=Thiohalocapsa halophila TaxID=69359 RepID=UPI002ADDF732|nr:DUF3301 domain-containing protein [Thiohalocapsa halophila]